MAWRERLNQLPIIFPLLMSREGDCIEEDSGRTHLIVTREYTYEWGATYHFSMTGDKKDRGRLLDELHRELGDSLTGLKLGRVRHYWFKTYTRETPRESTFNLLGRENIEQIFAKFGITDEVEKDLIAEAVARMDSLMVGDPRKETLPEQVLVKLADGRKSVVGECLYEIVLAMAAFTITMEQELGRL